MMTVMLRVPTTVTEDDSVVILVIMRVAEDAVLEMTTEILAVSR